MQPMYHQPQPQAQPTEWYYDPNHHQHQPHGLYNNSYNYKTDFNCLNQPPAPIHPNADPSIYNNGVNYYYPQNPAADPYSNTTQQQINNHPQMDYHQHSNYHQNFHNNSM